MSRFKIRLIGDEGSLRLEEDFDADSVKKTWSKLYGIAKSQGKKDGAFLVSDPDGNVVIRVGVATALASGQPRLAFHDLTRAN